LEELNTTSESEVQTRAKVMRQQIESAKDPDTRKKIVDSVNKEISESITQAKNELSTTEKRHAKHVYDLAKQRKITDSQAKAEKAALEKRIKNCEEAIEDVRASRKGPLSRAKLKNLEREERDLQKAGEMARRDIRELEKNASEKLSNLNAEYKKIKQDYH